MMSSLKIFSLCLLAVVLLICTSTAVDGFMIASPSVVRQQSKTFVAMAKDKEEDLELTRNVIREFMDKADGDTAVATTEASTEPVAAASEEK